MRRPAIRVTRDSLSYALGFLGSIYETTIADGPPGERLPFLVIFVGLITAPAFLRKDDKAKEAAKEPTAPPPVGGA